MKIISSSFFSNDSQPITFMSLYEGYVITDEFWYQLPRFANYSRLYFIINGSGMLISPKKQIKLEPGFVYLIPSGLEAGFYGTPFVEKLFFDLHISFGEGEAFENCFSFLKIQKSISYINELKEMYLQATPKDKFIVTTEIYKIICEFLKLSGTENATLSGYSTPILEAISFIKKNLSANLTVKKVCQHIHLSPNTFSVLFKKETNQTPSNFIESVVLNEAKAQLLYSNKTISEISSSLGYTDQFYFSRRFKKYFLKSPSEYRKNTAEITVDNASNLGMVDVGTGLYVWENKYYGNDYRGINPEWHVLNSYTWGEYETYAVYKVKPGTKFEATVFLASNTGNAWCKQNIAAATGEPFEFKIESAKELTGTWSNAIDTADETASDIVMTYDVPADCNYVKITFPQKGTVKGVLPENVTVQGNDLGVLKGVRYTKSEELLYDTTYDYSDASKHTINYVE